MGGAGICHAKSKLPENKPVPDLTKEVVTDLNHTYHLGPTGARGWIHKVGSYATPDDFEGYFTNEKSRQILITKVEKGSPADGVLVAGDVILGAGKSKFNIDARKAIADAIDDAETEKNKGVLRLLRWRPDKSNKEGASVRSKGKSQWVELKLKVMGTFSDTAPYNCPKSTAIANQTAELIFKEKRTGRLHIPALSLLATGEKKHIAAVKEYIRKKGLANPKMKLSVEIAQGSSAWTWSYAAGSPPLAAGAGPGFAGAGPPFGPSSARTSPVPPGSATSAPDNDARTTPLQKSLRSSPLPVSFRSMDRPPLLVDSLSSPSRSRIT